MALAPGALAMITISMTQKQSFESMPAAAQIIPPHRFSPGRDREWPHRSRNVDGFEFAGPEQSRQFHRIAAVMARAPRCKAPTAHRPS